MTQRPRSNSELEAFFLHKLSGSRFHYSKLVASVSVNEPGSFGIILHQEQRHHSHLEYSLASEDGHLRPWDAQEANVNHDLVLQPTYLCATTNVLLLSELAYYAFVHYLRLALSGSLATTLSFRTFTSPTMSVIAGPQVSVVCSYACSSTSERSRAVPTRASTEGEIGAAGRLGECTTCPGGRSPLSSFDNRSAGEANSSVLYAGGRKILLGAEVCARSL